MSDKVKPILSNRRIKPRIARKTNPLVAETIRIAQENTAWKPLAKILSNSTRLYSSVNLKEIDSKTTAGDTIVIPGKVLAVGELTKKVRIVALSISHSARAKLKATKSEFATILDEIKINQKGAGVKVLR
jgi:large subunit ribosomal protein L18e